MERHQFVNQSSGNTELYTPPEIVDAMRLVMGHFDLDPASCEIANQTVKAKHFYTAEDDGLTKPWFGNVWLNHPFGAREVVCTPNCKKKTCAKRGWCRDKEFPGNPAWIDKLVDSYELGEVKQAANIVFSSTSELWFRPLLWYPQCFIYGRTQFIDPTGREQNGATKGCVVTYLGPHVDRFARIFDPLGAVKLPYKGVSNG